MEYPFNLKHFGTLDLYPSKGTRSSDNRGGLAQPSASSLQRSWFRERVCYEYSGPLRVYTLQGYDHGCSVTHIK